MNWSKFVCRIIRLHCMIEIGLNIFFNFSNTNYTYRTILESFPHVSSTLYNVKWCESVHFLRSGCKHLITGINHGNHHRQHFLALSLLFQLLIFGKYINIFFQFVQNLHDMTFSYALYRQRMYILYGPILKLKRTVSCPAYKISFSQKLPQRTNSLTTNIYQ